MSKYESFDESEGVWRTVGGKHIFIRDGEDLSTAMKRSGKFKKKEKPIFSESKIKKTLYHGTGRDFESFEDSKIGSTTGNDGMFGRGFYFTENEKIAQDYVRDENNNYAKKGFIFEVKANVQKPFEWKSIKTEEQFNDFKNKMGFKDEGIYWNRGSNEIHSLTTKSAEKEFSEKLKENGYDAIIYRYDKNASEYVIFDNKQIKIMNKKKYIK